MENQQFCLEMQVFSTEGELRPQEGRWRKQSYLWAQYLELLSILTSQSALETSVASRQPVDMYHSTAPVHPGCSVATVDARREQGSALSPTH